MPKAIAISDNLHTKLLLRFGDSGNFSKEISRLLRLEEKVRAEVDQYDRWLAGVRNEL